MRLLPVEFLKFAYREMRTLSLGLSFAFFSSIGQTFLISLFREDFQQVFNLDSGSFGTMYAVATLASAVSLPYVGGWIDRTSLKRYGLSVAGGLALASLTVALSYHVAILFVGLYMLRLTGQGLSSHTARTAMARLYSSGRGKALSIANLGYPLGEGTLPLLITALLSYISWRTAWWGISGTVTFLFIPFLLLILQSSYVPESDRKEEPPDTDTSEPDPVETTSYLNLISELRFWCIAPAAILPGFWATGLILFQTTVAEQLQWSEKLMAMAFVGFAVGRVIFSLLAGPAIDFWSARTLFPLYLTPLGASLLIAYVHPGNWSSFLYMGLLGTTLGIGGSLKSALYAELYGTDIIGTVRSLFSAISVSGTALCPFLMGWLLEENVRITDILIGAMISVLIATALSFLYLYVIQSRNNSRSTQLG